MSLSDLDKAYRVQYSRANEFLYTLEVSIGGACILSAEAVAALTAAASACSMTARYTALTALDTVVQQRWRELGSNRLCTPETTRWYEALVRGFVAMKTRLERGC